MNSQNKRGKFIRVPAEIVGWLPAIGSKGLAVYTYICGRANPNRGTWCSESLGNMVKRLGMRRQTLQEILKQLVENGLLERRHQFHASILYRPVTPLPPIGQQSKNGLFTTQSIGQKRPNDSESTVHLGQSTVQKRTSNKIDNKRTKVVRTTTPDNAKTLVKHWAEKWEEKYQDAYGIDWGKDCKRIDAKLKRIPAETIRAKIDIFLNGYWESTWQYEKNRQRPKLDDFIRDLERIPLHAKSKASGDTGTTTEQLVQELETLTHN